ncbi:MAG: hypothetical protein OXH68_03870 [Gammaproteobacteria bacterium]|nr:hypothetical protein [Gammaproteobacteria bacterium]
MGDEDAAEALSGSRGFEGRVVEVFRSEPTDDPRVGQHGQLDRDLASGRIRYSPPPAATHKLDPQKAIIDEWLGKYPELSA